MLLMLKITTKSNCRNSGYKTFKTKLQPKINELTTHYNDIIEKDWLPAWEEINTNGDSVSK